MLVKIPQIFLMPSVMAKKNEQYRNYKHGELLFAFVLMLYLHVQFSTKINYVSRTLHFSVYR